MGRLFIAQILSYNKKTICCYFEIFFFWNWLFMQLVFPPNDCKNLIDENDSDAIHCVFVFLRVSLEPIQKLSWWKIVK